MLSLYEILKASKTGIAPDMWTALAGMNWSGAGSGAETKELTGIPPLSFTADGTPLLDYLISGNTVQTGTPTPDNPIQPQECGERTGNLTTNQKITSSSYSYTVTTHPLINALKNITPNENYTLSWEFSSNGSGGVSNRIRLYTSASGTVIKILQSGVSFTLTSEEISQLGALFCYFGIGNTDGYMDKFMLVEGSTVPSEYIPYGYKIPILSNSTTTPVYLGEAESTRLVKKVVYDGTESWNLSKQGNNARAYTPQVPECLSLSPALCTHFDYNVANVGYPRVGEFVINSSKAIIFGVDGNTFADVNAWEAYLAQQYANGTPVTVWYVLAEPQTGIVNEPLRKIGDYADTLSMEQARAHIPTLNGQTVIDVDTALKPSEVYIKYKGA